MNFTEILTNSRSGKDDLRNQAESTIDNMACSDFGSLLMLCAQFMANEQEVKENRQMCATLIKNMILYVEKHKGKWEQLDANLKEEVKKLVMSCLAAEEKDIKKSAATTIAGIAKLEIPRGEWPQIINVLSQTCQHENPNVKMSSIVTIGYISQELNPGQLAPEQVDSILSAIIQNIKLDTDTEILSHAITAFLNFLIFAKKNMEVSNDRDIIFNVIFDCLKHPDVKIRVYSMQCLVEISRIYYDFLASHMAELLNVTHFAIMNDDERVAIQAYEFWCSVSDEEVLRSLNNRPFLGFCNTALENLFSVCQHHLLNRDAKKEEQDLDSWNCAKAASCLLTNMSQCVKDSLLDKVFLLVTENIYNDNALIRESSIFAYGAIIETIHKEKIRGFLPGTIDPLLQMLNDKSTAVRNSVGWCLKKITEFHSIIFQEISFYDMFITTLMGHLQKNSKKVVTHLCDAINNLAMNLYLPNNNSGYLSKHMEQLLNILMQCGFTKDSYDPEANVALAAFFTMGTVIDYAPPDTYGIIHSFFPTIYNAFESTLNGDNISNQEMRYAYQGYLATVISSCTVGEKVKMGFEEGKAVYKLIKDTFEQRQNVYEEGIMAGSSLALSLGELFEPLIQDFGMFLMFGLQQWQDVSVCRTSINSTSDLLRALGSLMNNYISQIIPVILEILDNPTTDKYLKTQAFIVISDMFINTRDEAFKQYGKIMTIVTNALEAALFSPERLEDSDSIEYFKYLRERLLECLTCIIHTMKDINRMDIFEDYVPKIIDFCEKVVDDKYEPSIDVFENALGIIGDICDCYTVRLRESININAVNYMIGKLENLNIEKYNKLCEWAKIIINQVIAS